MTDGKENGAGVGRLWTRRQILRAGAGLGLALPLAGLLPLACSAGSDEGSLGAAAGGADQKEFTRAKIDWRQFEGESIVFGGLQHPWVQAVTPHLQAFTQLTGIQVQPDIQGEDQYVAKLPVTLSGGSQTPDVFMVFAYGQAVASRWLEPLDKYRENDKLTDVDWYDPNDVFGSARDFVVWPKDQVTYGLPITAEVETMFYRDDLIEKAPATFDEIQAVAKKAKSGDVAGVALRGMATVDAVAWPAAGFVFSHGGYLIDPDGRPTLNSPETVAGVESYASLIRAAGAKGISNWSWLEVISAMQQGQAAMMLDSSNAATDLLNPDKSRVAHRIKAAPFPKHDGVSYPNVWHWVAGINANSKKKDAAWLFLEWATSVPGSAMIAANGGTPPRTSAWENEAFRKKFGPQAADVVREMLTKAKSEKMRLAWQHPKWSEVGDAFARAVNAALTGSQPAAQALDGAQKRAEEAVG
jgi:multiple sugar transport system substrate-binding protein